MANCQRSHSTVDLGCDNVTFMVRALPVDERRGDIVADVFVHRGDEDDNPVMYGVDWRGLSELQDEIDRAVQLLGKPIAVFLVGKVVDTPDDDSRDETLSD